MQAMAARSRRAAPPRGSSRQRAGPPKAARPEARASPAPAAPASGLPRYLQRAPAGQPLPQPVRRDMEQRFGEPLGGVRVHADGGAAASAGAMGARAYTHQRDVVFGAGAYDPQSQRGRGLLAHELTHVLQQRRHGAGVQPSVADGGARRVAAGGDAAEREAEANAQRVHTAMPLTAMQPPMQPVQADWRDDLASAADTVGGAVSSVGEAALDAGGAVADAAAGAVGDVAMALVERVAPELVPIIRQGPMQWLRERVAEAFDGIAGALNAMDPSGTLAGMLELFTGLVSRAGEIVAALASGDCQPLLAAVGQLKDFVTEVAGAAWERLTTFLQPVGDFFSSLWSGYGAPAVEWLQQFAGGVWARVQAFGADLWNWTAPVRSAVGDAWGWVKQQLFGPDEGSADSAGGIVGWVTTKAGEAWDWVKEQTRPVWQPISNAAERVAELLPPPFLRDLGAQATSLSGELEASANAMDGGDAVAENRETLASVLPSVQRIIAGVRGAVRHGGQWLGEKVGAFGATVAGLMDQLRANSLLSMLANGLSWLQGAADRLVAWAQGTVASLFDLLLSAFDRLSPFVEAAAGVVRRLIGVVGNLLALPQLILSTVWEAIPCCIREPIKNFVVEQILGRIPVFGQFFTDPTLWPRVQATAMRILRQVFVDGDLPRAAWSFFQAVLNVLGLPPQLVVQVLRKAATAVGDILSNPVGFLLNLLGAVRAGFSRFFGNILTHLLGGIGGWLLSQVRDAGLTPPADFSLRSILGFVLDVLGVTVERIFEKLSQRLGPAVVARLRTMLGVATGVWRFITILVEQGPAGLWEELQSQLSNLWDTVLGGVIGWVNERIIDRAMRWLMSLLDVTGVMPVINTLVAVYNAIESFVQYLRQMLEIVSTVLDGVLGIARGAIDAAAGFLEGALSRSLPVAIGFLANQFGLGRLGQRIAEILATVRGTVDRALDWLIDRAIRLGQSLIDMARRGAAAVGSAVRSFLGLRVRVPAAGGQEHTIGFQGETRNAPMVLRSEPQLLEAWLATKTSHPNHARALALLQRIRDLQATADPVGASSAAPPSTAATNPNALIPGLMNELAQAIAPMVDADGGETEASSPPQYGSLHHGFGRTVEVERLTRTAAPGSEPTVEGGLWNQLRKRRSRSGVMPYWLRGHLLNKHLGGSGETWANLTPLTASANGLMSSRFEQEVKVPVRSGAVAEHFQVQVQYGAPARNQDLNEIRADILERERVPPEQRTAANERMLAKRRATLGVVEAEQYVPRSLVLFGTVRRGGTVTGVGPPIDVVADLRWRQYDIDPDA